ncbi:MAG: SWIM zinc finger family protein [bacterium]
MTFHDFKKDIDSQILERGFRYFKNGNVISVDEVGTGLWEAEVEGTENYNVTIITDKYKIRSWECDCPYDMDSICKHIVAVFYTIAEAIEIEKEHPHKKENSKKYNKKRIENIFKATSKEELQNFIIAQFSKERNLKNAFVAYFAELLDENPEEKYKIIVNNLYKAVQDRSGFIDYRNANKFSNSLNDLADKAEKILAAGNIKESLIICKVLIENTAVYLMEIDDSAGGLSCALENSFGTLSAIVSKAPPMLKDELFDYCIKEFRMEKYHDIGFEDRFLDLMPALISTEEQEKVFFELINDQIEIEKGKEYSSFSIVRLLGAKIDYLIRQNLDKDAKELIKENIIYPEFREIIIDEAVKKKDFENAKKLCLEGIVISEKEDHYGSSDKWRHKLLLISELEKNIPDVRKWSELIFFNSNFDMNYYRKLKSTYTIKNNNEWNDVSEKIIDKIKTENKFGSYSQADTLAKIFIEEKYIDRLLVLVQINSKHINFIDFYAKYLGDKYPQEMIALYSEAIKSHAKITEKKYYEEVAKYMKNLSKISGSENTLRQLLKYFRGLYRNRKAMMEILNKNFPEKV